VVPNKLTKGENFMKIIPHSEKSTKQLAIVALVISLSTGCASTAPVPTVQMQNQYDSAETAWARTDGTATVKGSAMVRLRNGDVLHCGAMDVRLIPVSAYTTERAKIFYGDSDKKQISHKADVFNPSPKGVAKLPPKAPGAELDEKRSSCDADGDFEFFNVPAGDWFVFTSATQERYTGSDNMFVSPNTQDAVYWMRSIRVKDGEVKVVRLN
jgi:hypothetical protein